jgi:CubicO group peptidase (beta-lactamase class C family)
MIPVHMLNAPAAVLLAMASPASANTDLLQCVTKMVAQADFSGVVSIVQPGGTVSHARGSTAGPQSAAITMDSQFNLGSAAKMFTAVATAQLIDAGKITLDDPIGRHVGGLAPAAASVTVRQLLTHSGGLGNFFSPQNLPLLQKAQSLADLKPLLLADTPAFTPGARFDYSNNGFLLLGLMIEQVSGKAYADYLADHVFAPAGMTSTVLAPAAARALAVGMTTMPEMPPGAVMMPPPGPPPGAAPGPAPGAMPPVGGMMVPPPGPLRPAPEAALHGDSAGGGFSTAADMQRFFAGFLGGRLTSAAMRDQLMTAQIAVPAPPGMPPRSHGLGFGVGDYRGHRWTGHNGGTVGVNAETMAFPDDQTSVVVLSNRDPPAATALLRALLPIILQGESCTPPAG